MASVVAKYPYKEAKKDNDFMNNQSTRRSTIRQTAEFAAELLWLWHDEKLLSEKSMEVIVGFAGELPTWEEKAEYSEIMLQIFQEAATEAEIMKGFREYVASREETILKS